MIDLDYFRNHFPTDNILNNSASDIVIDNPKRVRYLNAPLHSLLHLRKHLKLNQTVLQQVKSLFQERYGYQDAKAFDKVWNKIGAKVWTPSKALTMGSMLAIDKAFQKRLVYHGKGIESSAQPGTGSPVQKLVQNLLHGSPFSEELINPRTLKAILVKKDPELLQEFKAELQRELEHLLTQLPKTKQQEIVWKTFLGNVLGFLPFTYPSSGDTLKIPVLENGSCRLVEYTLEVIPLEFNKLSTPMPLIAMTAKGEEAPPILAFMGTTYPSGDGFAATLQSDFSPGYSVGELAYEINQKKIAAWMQDKKDVHVMGISLGGSLALHAARHHSPQIGRVDVYQPPGLYADCWTKELDMRCKVNIYTQPEDLVSELGFWPTRGNVHSYEVLQHQGLSENPLSSHVKAFSGSSEITIIKHDPEKQNQSLRRRIFTILHRALGPLLVFLPVEFILLVRHYAKMLARFALRTAKDLTKLFHAVVACL